MRTLRRSARITTLLAALAMVTLAGCAGAPAGDERFAEATVVRVVDGDTAVFRLANGTEEKTRFIGVDTPESTNRIEVYGKQAAAYTSRVLVPGRRVYLERDVEERDRYGRLLAYVWLERPSAISDAEIRDKMFNARLALEGYAQQMTIQPNSRYADEFTRYVREARTAEKGLWGLDPSSVDAPRRAAATAPNKADSPELSPIEGACVGNRNTRVFHRPTCSSASTIKESNRVELASRQAAVEDGFEPCGRCKP